MAKPADEKITNINEKIEQLKQQKRAILAREKEQERKVRTRRLIQRGAIIEKCAPELSDDALTQRLQLADEVLSLFSDTEKLTPEEIKKFLKKHISNSLYLEKALQRPVTQKELDWCIKLLNQST